MTFKEIKVTMVKNVEKMFKKYSQLYVTGVGRDEIWDTYLNSFPEGTNEIFRERTEHDCQHCKQFIRQFGGVVGINSDNTLTSIWDVKGLDDDTYSPVFAAMSEYVKSKVTSEIFSTTLTQIGVDYNMAEEEDGAVTRWEHFFTKIPKSHRNTTSKSDENLMGKARDSKNVLKRSFDTISRDALDTIIELIKQNSIYKGSEWTSVLDKFSKLMESYEKVTEELRDNYCWRISNETGPVISKIRNHSIGVLLIDVSEGVPLDDAVKKYEAIVAPTNYKRPKPIFTKKMLQQAKETVEELGLTDSLRRRFATIDDITVNNVLFADRTSTKRMKGEDIFEELEDEMKVNPKKFSKAAEIPIDKFIADVLPTANKVELLLENRHKKNVVSLISPVHKESKPMFKWGNNFSWAYTGNITDSMKERVKQAGGNVSGVLRFSIQWNEDGDNQNDFDAHCVEPSGLRIHFPNKGKRHISTGMLDVDIVTPGKQVAVENITYTDLKKMPFGTYEFSVHLYSNCGGKSGFRAQIEFDGQIFDYDIQNSMRQGQHMPVAKVKYSENGFELIESKDNSVSNTQIAGLSVNALHPVSICLLSPNYWDDKTMGNKHYMFMLQNCKNEECPNGFFNEFLTQELDEHKRVFAALGDKMKVESSDAQLTGLGFSSTKRDHLLLKVHGHSTRVMKVLI